MKMKDAANLHFKNIFFIYKLNATFVHMVPVAIMKFNL